MTDHEFERLTDEELADVKRRRANARFGLALDGRVPSAESEALFDAFERDRLPHDECLRIIGEWTQALIAGRKFDYVKLRAL